MLRRLFALAGSLLLAALCSTSQAATATPDTSTASSERAEGKVLVAYFSGTGITAGIAKDMADLLQTDLFRISNVQPYSAADMAYDEKARANQEQKQADFRPQMVGDVSNMEQYDTVLLGYPIWAGLAPRVVLTFLERYDFAGKTIVPFCTSGGSPLEPSIPELQALTPQAHWLTGKRFEAHASRDDVRAWLQQLNLLGAHTSAAVLDQTVVPAQSDQAKAPVFNFEKHSVMLNSGYEMPINGIGTYSLLGDTCYDAITTALKTGVRLIDTAYMYRNEEEVGRAIRDSGVPREEIFVITKLYPNQFSQPEEAIEQALKKLNIGYIDMMLLHHPGHDDVKAYKAVEKAVAAGKVRSFGLSNWYVEELEEFLPQVSIMPALVQNEIHPYYQENDVIPFIQQQGIVVQGWYPLGGRGHTQALLNDPVITKIAQAHGKSAAQVILRWNLQKGVVVIPGSSNPAHIKENTELYDFALTAEEMAQINALDRNEKHDWY